MEHKLKENLKRLASLTPNDIGENENNVKQKFIIPFLECFGYDKFEFEYSSQGSRIDIFIKSNSRQCIVIEAKGYKKNLNDFIAQLKRYSDEKSPLLAIISNGDEIRFYDPFFKKPEFSDRLIYSFHRKDFKDDSIIERVEKILSKENLENDLMDDFITERLKEIKTATKEIQALEDLNQEEINEIKEVINGCQKELEIIRAKIEANESEIEELLEDRNEKILEVCENYLLPKIESNIENGNDEGTEGDENGKRKKSKSPSASKWAKQVPELSKFQGLNTWKKICNHLKIDVGADSARRKLDDWVKMNRRNWPSVPSPNDDN